MANGTTPWFELGRGAGEFFRGLQASGVSLRGGPAEPPPVDDGKGAEEGLFPDAGVDIFLSHFIIALRLEAGDQAGNLVTLSLPSAVQTVARTQPFTHDPAGRQPRALALPEGATLPDAVREEDFQVRPKGFFRAGAETVLLQILNLDAKADTPFGPVRIILGETFKREYEDLFEPSFGAAQALGKRGFPAQLFFSPNAIIESPFGTVKTRPKALVGARVSEFPPVGSHPSLVEPVPLDTVEALRAGRDRAAELQAAASIVGLSHPIDAVIYEAGDPAFRAVERSASR